MSQIVKTPPRALAPAATTEDARAQLVQARERLAKKLEVIERTISPLGNWRTIVKRHPVVTIGSALLLGYALAKYFSRK